MKKRISFFSKMLSVKSEIRRKRDKFAGHIYLELSEIVDSGSYSSINKASVYVRYFLEGYSDKDIARSFSITDSRVRGIKKHISDELYEVFGDDFFDLLMNSESIVTRDKLRVRLYCAKNWSMASLEIVNPFILSASFEMEDIAEFNSDLALKLSDCLPEISLLKKYSRLSVKEDIAMVDIEKLKYLLTLLNTNCNLNWKRELMYMIATNKEVEYEHSEV